MVYGPCEVRRPPHHMMKQGSRAGADSTMWPATSPRQPAVRSALAEPTVNPPWGWVVALSLVNLGRDGRMVRADPGAARRAGPGDLPEHKEQVLGWVLGVGAFVSTVCNPLFGAFSDRTTLRMGRRLPWILVGAVGGSLSLLRALGRGLGADDDARLVRGPARS